MSSATGSTENATAAKAKARAKSKLRAFLDVEVLIAGSASRSHSSGSYILLQLGEFTLIEGLICPYVREEAERNLVLHRSGRVPRIRRGIEPP